MGGGNVGLLKQCWFVLYGHVKMTFMLHLTPNGWDFNLNLKENSHQPITSQGSLCKCNWFPLFCLFFFTGRGLTQAIHSPSTNTDFTQLTTQLAHQEWGDGLCLHVCICADSMQDFPECVCDMGVTVDNALLRCRLAVLLWADIRASMSSSSSENSCRRQR